MAKKKQQLIAEVLTERDWEEKIKHRDGLTIADIYCGWAGPCIAMQSETKKYKVEHPEGALLSLAVVCSDDIWFLSRFRGHCEPTFMFLVNGQMVNMYIGCHAPKFLKFVNDEFVRELKARRGEGRRRILPFDKPTPAEILRQERLDDSERAERQAEEDRITAALNAIRTRAYEKIASALNATTVVLFLPHSLEDDRTPEVAQRLKDKWEKMGIEVVKEESVSINGEMANEIFYERRLPQHKVLVEHLATGNSVAMLLKKTRPGEGEGEPDKGAAGDVPAGDENDMPGRDTYPIARGKLEKAVAETIYGFYPEPNDPEEEQAREKMAELLRIRERERMLRERDEESDDEEKTEKKKVEEEKKKEGEEGEEDEEGEEGEEEEKMEEKDSRRSTASPIEAIMWTPKEMRPAVDSPAALLLRRFSADRVNLPGIYAPLTAYSKAAAVRVLFPAQADPFYEMEELPPEPAANIAMAFDVSKREEVMEAIKEFPDQILNIGYFNEKRQKLGDSYEGYQKLARRGFKDTLVLSVSKATSAPMLALATIGPSYISPNAKIAKEDENTYFAQGVVDLSDVHPETPPEPEDDEVVAPVVLPPKPAAAVGEGAPAEGAPAEGAPGEGAPAEGAPGEGAPAEGAEGQAAAAAQVSGRLPSVRPPSGQIPSAREPSGRLPSVKQSGRVPSVKPEETIPEDHPT